MKNIQYSIGKTYLDALSKKSKIVPKFCFENFIKIRYRETKYKYYWKNESQVIIYLKKKKEIIKYDFDPKKLQALTPVDTHNRYDMYIKTFEEIYSNDNYLNIGISGIYGSGKSTLIKAIRSKPFIGNNFSISLADFKDEGILKKDLPKSRLDMIEIKILRQLYYQSDFRCTRVLRTTNWQEMTKFDLIKKFLQFSVMLGLFILYIDLWNKIWPFCTSFSITKMPIYLLGALKSKCMLKEAIAIVLLTIIAITYCWYLIRKYYLKIRFGIKADKINIEMESEKDDISAISEGKYLHELMYLLKYNSVDTIFIEDLDRFDNTDILAGLKEINFLINSYNYKRHFFPIRHVLPKIKNRIPISKRKIRFIYAIRDDVFIDSDRLKFFDIIIPIIPITNSSNSFLRLNAALSQNLPDELLEQLDMNLVKDVCKNIWDMRMVNEIANEFFIFLAEKLKNMNLSDIRMNTIFCLIILKVRYPLEYKSLSQNKGFCYEKIHDASFMAEAFILSCDKENRKKIREVNDLLSLFMKKGYLTEDYLDYMTYAKLDTLDEDDQEFYKASKIDDDRNDETIRLKVEYSIKNMENFLPFIKDNDITNTYLWNPQIIIRIFKDLRKNKDIERNDNLLNNLIYNMYKDFSILSTDMIFSYLRQYDNIGKDEMKEIFLRLMRIDKSKEIFADILDYVVTNDDLFMELADKKELFIEFLNDFNVSSLHVYKNSSKDKLRFGFGVSWSFLISEIVEDYYTELVEITENLEIMYEIEIVEIPTDSYDNKNRFLEFVSENAYYQPYFSNIKSILQSTLGNQYWTNDSLIANYMRNKNNHIVRRAYNVILDHLDMYIESCMNNDILDEEYVIWSLEHYSLQNEKAIDNILQQYKLMFRTKMNETKINAVRCLKCIENGNYPSNIDSYLELFNRQAGTSNADYLDNRIAYCINTLGLDKNEKLHYENIGILLRNNAIEMKYYYQIVINLGNNNHKIALIKGTQLDDDKLELLIRRRMLTFDRNTLEILANKKRLLNIFIMMNMHEFYEQEQMIVNNLNNDYIKSVCDKLLKQRVVPDFKISGNRIEVREN